MLQTPRKRSKNITHSNPSPKKKSRDASNKDSLNMPDSIGGDSEGKTASSPLVRGPAKQQSRNQDSRASEEGSSPACDEVGRYSTGNEEKAKKKGTGSRKVLNLLSFVSEHGVNNRACLLYALDSILNGHIRRSVCNNMRENMPAKGDTPMKIADQALEPHGLYLRRVHQEFCKPGGVEYNLLQLRECQMVLTCDLTRADGSGVAHHAIWWDGNALLDDPYNIVVEEEDRSDKEHARMVFNELCPKDTFKDCRVVQAFVVAKLSNKHKDDARRRRRKKRARAT